MATSVSAKEAATTLRKLRDRSQNKMKVAEAGATQQLFLRDTNKRPRGMSTGELQEGHNKKTETTPAPTSSAVQASYGQGQQNKENNQEGAEGGAELEAEDKGRDIPPDSDIPEEIAAIEAKNKQLQSRVKSLRHKFSMRAEETHPRLLGLGALNAVAHELASLQKDYQERSTKNAALIQESLAQISNCAAQVDTLRRCRGVTTTQLQNFRQECTLQMNRLVSRLGDLADSSHPESQQQYENQQQVERLKEDVCAYRGQFIEGGSAPSHKRVLAPTQQDTTDRINVALAQLDQLHAEMFQLKQTLTQENQSFRRHVESLVSQQMTHIRDMQENDTERIHEEMDEIRSGMCGILKDIHRLKERTKYLVPSMGPKMAQCTPNGLQTQGFGNQKDGLWMNIPTANPLSTGYSMTMATRQCHDQFPHCEHGFDGACYCPGVLSTQLGLRYANPRQTRSIRSSNSSLGRSDDENCRMLTPENTPVHAAQPTNSPHYSSRSSSLSDRLSCYGEEHVVPNDEPTPEQLEQRILEQHRLFWIGEGAG